jgi:hypothetical protein
MILVIPLTPVQGVLPLHQLKVEYEKVFYS